MGSVCSEIEEHAQHHHHHHTTPPPSAATGRAQLEPWVVAMPAKKKGSGKATSPAKSPAKSRNDGKDAKDSKDGDDGDGSDGNQAVEHPKLGHIDPHKISTNHVIRAIKPSTLRELQESMDEEGYLLSEAITVVRKGGKDECYELVDGHHRLKALLQVLKKPPAARPKIPNGFMVVRLVLHYVHAARHSSTHPTHPPRRSQLPSTVSART